jgi:hypothetical protein
VLDIYDESDGEDNVQLLTGETFKGAASAGGVVQGYSCWLRGLIDRDLGVGQAGAWAAIQVACQVGRGWAWSSGGETLQLEYA